MYEKRGGELNLTAPFLGKLCAHLCAQALLSQLRCRRTVLVDFLIGQRAVRCTEQKLEGQGLLALTQLLTTENVEELDGLDEFARPLFHGGAHALCWDIFIHHERDVLVQCWEGG